MQAKAYLDKTLGEDIGSMGYHISELMERYLYFKLMMFEEGMEKESDELNRLKEKYESKSKERT
jgi:hypothetical protein